jgi:subtilisin family serine protease
MIRHPKSPLTTRRRGAVLGVSLIVALLGLCTTAALAAAPNDPYFSLQWGDSNAGQLIPGQESEERLGPEAKGTPGADDRALEAWGLTTGSGSIVIGETDTGVDYTHPDLAANIWSNPGGVGGCAAGTHGYDVLAHSCEPMDDDITYGGHGTHVAGIMGAVGNNGVGVAGMNWQTTILPVKWLSSAEGANSTENLIEALQWVVAAKQAGVNVRVVNDSATFRGTAYSQALSNEIDTLGANNILFVTAAGNTGDNNDEEKVRRYPCGYDRPTEICVTATDNNDKLPSWANYGPHTVDLAAPGVSVYSTLRGGKYGYLSGGSMAAAQVSGAAALILSAQPSLSATQLKTAILEHVDVLPSLAGKVRTGGRLDVAKALAAVALPLSGGAAGGATGATVGASSQTAAQGQPAAPKTASSAGTDILASRTLPVRRGRATVKLRCLGTATCRSTLKIVVRLAAHSSDNSGRKRLQLIGRANFAIRAGQTGSIKVTLSSLARRLLKAAHGKLKALLTIFRSSKDPSLPRIERVRLLERERVP